jgi:Zinc knuckle
VKCFECGDDGHVSRNCPNREMLTGEPRARTWCGMCDKQTRLVDLGDSMKRCPDCHPLAGQFLKQHTRCGDCRKIIFIWDRSPCDMHDEVGKQRVYVAPGTRNQDLYPHGFPGNLPIPPEYPVTSPDSASR